MTRESEVRGKNKHDQLLPEALQKQSQCLHQVLVLKVQHIDVDVHGGLVQLVRVAEEISCDDKRS